MADSAHSPAASAAIILLMAIATAYAQETAAPRPGDRETPTEVPAGSEALPEDLLPLMLARPQTPVIAPRGEPKRRRSLPPPAPDGGTILGATARLRREDRTDGWVLEFAHEAIPPRRVLPCRLLEAMERAGQGARFRVWGECTSFRGHRYFLPFSVAIPREVPAQTGTQPATQASGSDNGAATIDDVVGELLRTEPGRPIIPQPDEPEETASPSPATRGDVIVDRLIRLVPEEHSDWLLARFESDNALTEPPMRLLPCRMLGLAIWHTGDNKPLRVTGHVTRYKGRRYLLLRKVIPERDLGRF